MSLHVYYSAAGNCAHGPDMLQTISRRSLLSMCGARKREGASAVPAQVRILEAFMDFSPPAATAFREIGGLSSMIDRLKLEVQAAPVASAHGRDGPAEAMQTDVAGSSSAAAASSPAGAVLTQSCRACVI